MVESRNKSISSTLKKYGLWTDVVRTGKGYNIYLVHKGEERISNRLTFAELRAWLDGYITAITWHRLH